MYVEKSKTPEEFVKTAQRFARRADRVVVQRYIPSDFDWRVGILDGKVLYVCQYRIPSKRWKILTYTNEGRAIYGAVKGADPDRADPKLLDIATRAARAMGNGFYGVDLKQVGDDFVVIEVNDNPTIMAGDEDQKAPQLYETLVRYLMNDGYGA
jgi:glutathione synthase/RimK-type ligase-like ATP-grasp enzyme